MLRTTKPQRAKKIKEYLDELYPTVSVPLDHKDPYTLLIAVLLSAQCTDERVNQVTPILFKEADNPTDMVALGAERIREIIKPCGLSPKKSKAIAELSQILLDTYGGIVPENLEELEKLPGVGHKTASVVMAQAFNVPAFPVDTHIHRTAFRWNLSSGKNVAKTEEDLKRLFPIDSWNKLHLQIIYFGREYCSARAHNPYECPLCKQFGRKTLFKEYDKEQALKIKKAKQRS